MYRKPRQKDGNLGPRNRRIRTMGGKVVYIGPLLLIMVYFAPIKLEREVEEFSY